MGGASFKNWSHPKSWTLDGTVLGKPKIPKPDAPPPPPDTSAPILKELARQATERALQKGKGRSAAVGMLGSVEPYRAPGSRGTTG